MIVGNSPGHSKLGFWDLHCAVAPGMRDFWVTRQEEILILAQSLQYCVERLGTPSGALCNAAWYLQKCIAPLMHLDRDEIVKTSLWGLTDNGQGASPTLVEEVVLLKDEPEVQEVTMFPHGDLGESNSEDPIVWSDALHPPAPSTEALGTNGNCPCDSCRVWHRARH